MKVYWKETKLPYDYELKVIDPLQIERSGILLGFSSHAHFSPRAHIAIKGGDIITVLAHKIYHKEEIS